MSIDYERSRREHPKLKTALTRAINSGDPKRVETACRKAVAAWRLWGAWPDDWHRWNVALGDAHWQDASVPSHMDEL
jgi:hypothetical protein